MPKILQSYSPQQLEPSIQINTTSWVYNQSTSVNITVTLGEAQKPYTGTVSLQYTSGISGPSSVQISNGTGTVSISRTGLNDATVTITVPKSANVKEKTVQFTGTISGQNLYEAGSTYWYVERIESFYETGDAGNVDSRTRYSTSVYLENNIIYSGSSKSDYNRTSITVGGVTYYRGDLVDTDHETVDGGSSNNYTRYRRYYYAIRRA